MARVGCKAKDWRVRILIRRYLRAGVLLGGVVSVQEKGAPQGGPLSPLLSNIVLDELDKELERVDTNFAVTRTTATSMLPAAVAASV